MKLNIALSGYGKMGKEVEKAALLREHSVILKVDNTDDWKEVTDKLSMCDVIIDFSLPTVAPEVIKLCFEKNIPVVSGTTGWDTELTRLQQQCINENKSFFYAPNFSIGVNIFFEINRRLAEIMNNHKTYLPRIHEIHHIKKLDAPSGTALALARDLTNLHSEYKSGWTSNPDEGKGRVLITSERTGEIPGTHFVEWNSDTDSIAISHTAHSRQGFAMGAVIAAEWLVGRKGCFSMRDMLKIN